MAKKRKKLSNEQKLQAQVKKLAHELEMVNHTNKSLTEQVNRAEIRDNDRRTAISGYEDKLRAANEKTTAAVGERDRLIRMVDQFTSIQIVSPTTESRNLRDTRKSPF